MALWHFKFSLVPTQGMIAVHGGVPTELACHKVPTGTAGIEVVESEFVDYWAISGVRPESLGRIARLLAPDRSWSMEAKMYGDSEGDRIEVWEDGIDIALDLRSFSLTLLEQVLAIAQESDCKIVVHGSGEVVDPALSHVLTKVKLSGAYRFCTATDEYFRSREGH